MTKVELLSEIEHVKNESLSLQSNLVKELKELESEPKNIENRARMAQISVLHAKDLWDTCNNVIDLERKLNLL